MKSKKTGQKNPSELRKRAEEKLKSQTAQHGVMSDSDTQQLIHELQVHQIELEMQNDELRKAQAELEESRRRYSDLYDFAPVGYFTFDKNGLILEVNLTAASELGVKRSLLIDKPFRTYIPIEDKNIFDLHLQQVFKGEDRRTCEIRLRRKAGEFYAQLESIMINDSYHNNVCRTSVIDISERKKAEEALRKAHDELEIKVKERTADLTIVNEALLNEIALRKGSENQVRSTNALLKLFTRKSSRKEYLDSVVELIHSWSGCCCVGIRILDIYGKIPYESYVGFSKEFWESENWLSVRDHQCACIRVILGKPELQDISAMTPFGSFRSDNTMKFVGELPEEEQARFRGVCVLNGFTSVAVIPIRYQEQILGAIHIADKKEGMVTLTLVEFLESMSPLIGEAIQKFSTEEELKKYYHHLEGLVEDRTA
ncbi:MAG: PAS domain S-box protein [Nitrospirota bacterium]